MAFEFIKFRNKSPEKEPVKYTLGEGIKFGDLDKKTELPPANERSDKYTPGKGIEFSKLLDETPDQREQISEKIMIDKKIEYVTNHGINFSEVYDKEVFENKTFLEKHAGLMKLTSRLFEKIGITSDGHLTKVGALKILAVLFVPGSTEFLIAHQAFKLYQERKTA